MQEKSKFKKNITEEELTRMVREQNEMFEKMALEKTGSRKS